MKAEFAKLKLTSDLLCTYPGIDVLLVGDGKGKRLIDKLPYGEFIELEYQEAQNYLQRCAYWAELESIAENHKAPGYEFLDHKNKLHFWLRVKVGFVKNVYGNIVEPKSTSYEECSGEEFQEYFNSVRPWMDEIRGS